MTQFLPAKHLRRRTPLLAAAVQLSVAGFAFGSDGTFTNVNVSTLNYNDTNNWVNGIIAGGVDSTATVDLNFNTASPNLTTCFLNQNVTLGTLKITNSGSFSRNFSMQGAGGSDIVTRPVLTFATSSGMPKLIMSAGGATPVPQMNMSGFTSNSTAWIIASTQGLYLDLAGGDLWVLSSISPWVSGYFSGPLIIGRGTYNNQFTGAGGVPVVHYGVGDPANPSYKASFSFRGSVSVQGIDGTANGWIDNNTSGTVSFTQNAQNYFMQSVSTLTLGTGNDSGSFSGTVGKHFSDGSTVFHSNLSIVKDGTGTQRFNGPMFHSGSTIVNAGTLIINGNHTAVVSSGFSSYASLSVGSGGTYSVSGTLAGNGTIKPHETLGTGAGMISVNSGGVISPGDGGAGTLTLDGSDSLSPLLNMGAGSSFLLDVGGSSAADLLSIINGQANDVTFHSNTLQMNVLPGFGAGTYTLFTSNVGGAFSGLTVNGSGVITSGLQLDSSFLTTYAGSTLSLIGNNIVLNAVGGTSGLTWAGPVGANWDHSTNSFTGSGGLAAFADGNAVTFADVSVGTVQLVGNLLPSSVTVSNNAGTYVFTGSGSMSGAASLTKTGTGTLILQSGNAYTGGTTVSAGTLIAGKLSNGTLNINGGTVQLTAKPNANDVSGTTVVPALGIAVGGKLDLTNNALVVDYTLGSGSGLATTVRQQLLDGRLFSTLATSGKQIGYADNAVLNAAAMGGVTLDSTSVVLAYTFSGDANLDGKVNTLDFNRLAGGFGTGTSWLAGDFSYDGLVDSVDFGLLASQYGKSMPAPSPTLGAVVPEPTAGFLVALGFAAIARRRTK